MAKVKSSFVCQSCGNTENKWSGKCTACGEWNSFVEETVSHNQTALRRRQPKAVRLDKVGTPTASTRLQTAIKQLDTVLGGGIVKGSILLLAGEPGIGKSTLLLEVADKLASAQRVLYISGEESQEQIKLRAGRLQVKNRGIELLTTVSTDEAVAAIASGQYDFAVVDSIQTIQLDAISSGAGSISQITNSALALQNAAKTSQTAVLMVGHVTKEGNIAGPKLLEHLVDAVFYLEGEKFGNFKILRGQKNRFGPTNEVALFEMRGEGMVPVVNPSALLLAERSAGDGSVVFPVLEGSRAILVEVQALVAASPFGYPKRTATGFDLNRLNLLLAVLHKRASLNLSAHDVFINVVGGMRVSEPAADLPVALAIASARKGRPVKAGLVAFGEIGLSGEIRSVAQAEPRLKEAKRLGFKHALMPHTKTKSSLGKPVNDLAAALKAGLTPPGG